MPKIERPNLSLMDFENAVDSVRTALMAALEKNGQATEVSWHEILGDVTEEYKEFTDEVQANSPQRINELHDIAIAAIWGIASVKAGFIPAVGK